VGEFLFSAFDSTNGGAVKCSGRIMIVELDAFQCRGPMGSLKKPHFPTTSNPPPSSGNPTLEAVTRYRTDETARWRRSIVSLIFVGMLISLLVHLNIGFLLSLLSRGGDGTVPFGAFTNIEFAILDTENFTELPEGVRDLSSETAQTQASSEMMDATKVTLNAENTNASLTTTTSTLTPSLSGGGSAGLGVGMGGSGGAGTSFFGITSKGTRFCYIVDVSGSMRNGERLPSAMAELTRSLQKLPDFARFYILFYSSGIQEPAIQRGWNTARASTVRRIVREFQQIQASGGTNPIPAFKQALSLQPLPEVIYFMTDGELTGFSTELLSSMMPMNNHVIINTIAFADDSSQQLLRAIATMTGGQFTFVKTGGLP